MKRLKRATLLRTVSVGALLAAGAGLSCSSTERGFDKGGVSAGSAGSAGLDAHAGSDAAAGEHSARAGSAGSSTASAGSSTASAGSSTASAGNSTGGQGADVSDAGAGGDTDGGAFPGAGRNAGGTPNGGGSAGTGDVTAPTVVSVSPTGTGVVKSSAIVVKFSEAMKAASASAVKVSSGGTVIALGTGVWSSGGTTLTFQPTVGLEYAAGEDPLTAKSYTIDVQDGAQDAAGNGLALAFNSSFTTLRRVQTVLTTTQVFDYFDADSTYGGPAGPTFNVIRQVGGGGYEDQYTEGVVAFDKNSAVLTPAASTAESVALELYATSTVSGATLKFSHINSSDLTNVFTTLSATTVTTSVTLTSFGAANSWWSIDVTPVFKHASFNLASYSSLQFLLFLDAATGTAAGSQKLVTFTGGTTATNKPRLRVTRLLP